MSKSKYLYVRVNYEKLPNFSNNCYHLLQYSKSHLVGGYNHYYKITRPEHTDLILPRKWIDSVIKKGQYIPIKRSEYLYLVRELKKEITWLK